MKRRKKNNELKVKVKQKRSAASIIMIIILVIVCFLAVSFIGSCFAACSGIDLPFKIKAPSWWNKDWGWINIFEREEPVIPDGNKPGDDPIKTDVYTITFDADGGTLYGETEFTTNKDGKLEYFPFAPVRDGYNFLYWYVTDNETIITTDTVFKSNNTVYAKWNKVDEYTIKFDPNGGKLTNGINQLTTTIDGYLETLPPEPIRDGYWFKCWADTVIENFVAVKKPVTVNSYKFNSNTTVYAQWQENAVYTITFDPAGGELAGSINTLQTTVRGNLESLLATPIRLGYAFDGWFSTDGDIVTTGKVFTEDTTIIAHWTKLQVVLVTFDPNGGKLSSTVSQIVTDENGLLSTLPPAPVKENNIFMGWYTSAEYGVQIDTEYVFTSDTTVYAHWNLDNESGDGNQGSGDNQGGDDNKDDKIFTITFNPNGGELSDDITEMQTSANGKLTNMPLNPVYVGYDFSGWYTSIDGGNLVSSEYEFKEDTTVYAHWDKLNIYNIMFDPNNGEMTDSKNIYQTDKYGKLHEFPKDPIRFEYEFIGWYTAMQGGDVVNNEYIFTSDTTVYAHWAENRVYTITLDPNGGELADGVTTVHTARNGKLSNIPTYPLRDNYLFINWFSMQTGGTVIDTDYTFTSDTTIYAQWAQNFIFNIAFDPNGGELADNTTVMQTSANGKLTTMPTPPIRDSHDFIGWYTAQTGGTVVNTDYPFTDDTTVYAHWEQHKIYNIEFNPNGGNLSDNITVMTTEKNGKLISLPSEPIYYGYSFAGWYTLQSGGARISTDYLFSSNTTVYAHWDYNGIYEITFNANGGILIDTENTLLTDKGKLSKLPQDPIRNYYTFNGWYTSSSGGTRVDTNYIFSGDTVVYAHWIDNFVYTITFNPNGGTMPDGITTLETLSNGKLEGLPEDPIRDRYDFTGWYTAQTGGTRISTDYQFNGNTTVYAHWDSLAIYTITFNPNGGTLSDSISQMTTQSNGKLSNLPTAPTRANYTFSGWYTASINGNQVTTSYIFSSDTTVYAHWTANSSSGGSNAGGNLDFAFVDDPRSILNFSFEGANIVEVDKSDYEYEDVENEKLLNARTIGVDEGEANSNQVPVLRLVFDSPEILSYFKIRAVFCTGDTLREPVCADYDFVIAFEIEDIGYIFDITKLSVSLLNGDLLSLEAKLFYEILYNDGGLESVVVGRICFPRMSLSNARKYLIENEITIRAWSPIEVDFANEYDVYDYFADRSTLEGRVCTRDDWRNVITCIGVDFEGNSYISTYRKERFYVLNVWGNSSFAYYKDLYSNSELERRRFYSLIPSGRAGRFYNQRDLYLAVQNYTSSIYSIFGITNSSYFEFISC